MGHEISKTEKKLLNPLTATEVRSVLESRFSLTKRLKITEIIIGFVSLGKVVSIEVMLALVESIEVSLRPALVWYGYSDPYRNRESVWPEAYSVFAPAKDKHCVIKT